MKTLKKLEKGRTIWLIFFSIIAFLFLRLPSLIEPLWYGDEGIYEVIGMALNKGRLLYSQIWDNKPPLLYAIYALVHSDQFTIRFLSLLTGLISIIVFYLLSRQLFHSRKIHALTTAIFVFLIGSPLLEANIANAENFMLLPILTAALLIYKFSKYEKTSPAQKPAIRDRRYLILFSAGLLLGISFLFKTVAIFDLTAFFIFLCFIFLSPPSPLPTKRLPAYLLKTFFIYVLGFLIPIAFTTLYFLFTGTFNDFIHATFFGNIEYVGYQNYLLLPQGLLFLKILLLASILLIIFIKRHKLSPEILFLYIWFTLSLFNSLFSGRPWTHYLLVVVPSASLMLGLLFTHKFTRHKIYTSSFLLLLIFFAVFAFQINFTSISKTFLYYQNFALYASDNRSLDAYQEFFDPNVPRDYQIAQFITTSTRPEDEVFIWGNNPQIYALADKLPPGKYTVEYHISQNPTAINETINSLRRKKPRFIIVLGGTPDMPFAIGNYINKFSLNNSTVYEITL